MENNRRAEDVGDSSKVLAYGTKENGVKLKIVIRHEELLVYGGRALIG